jgi:hypothetical protein
MNEQALERLQRAYTKLRLALDIAQHDVMLRTVLEDAAAAVLSAVLLLKGTSDERNDTHGTTTSPQSDTSHS